MNDTTNKATEKKEIQEKETTTQKETKNGFDLYCDLNPSAPECLMYDD
ncbi:MAG: CP12 domain-containing protein [Polynucleobacter sp.]|jgi:hypothetical protein